MQQLLRAVALIQPGRRKRMKQTRRLNQASAGLSSAGASTRAWLMGGTALVLLVMAVAACGPEEQAGLVSVAPNGRWATLMEYSGEPPSTKLVLLDLQASNRTFYLSDGVSFPSLFGPATSASPDGRYLLIRSTSGWLLVDAATQQAFEFETEEWLEFLHDGEILIASYAENGTSRLFTTRPELLLAEPGDQNRALVEKRSLLVDQVRFIFEARLRFAMFLQLYPHCGRSSAADQDIRTMVVVDALDEVTVIRATPDRIAQEKLTKLSPEVVEWLKQQIAILSQFLRPEIEDEIEQEAENAGRALSSEELDAEVEERLQSYLFFSLPGFSSPDGTKLLFVRVIPIDDPIDEEAALYTLTLIDLETGRRQVLASEADWEPVFFFSPDGQQILYESNLEGARALYIADSDGTNTQRLPLQGVLDLCWH